MRVNLRETEKLIENLVISIPLLRPETHQPRLSLPLSPSRIEDGKYLTDQSLPESESSHYPIHSDFHRHTYPTPLSYTFNLVSAVLYSMFTFFQSHIMATLSTESQI